MTTQASIGSRTSLLNSRLFDPYRWSTAPQVKSACKELLLLLGLNDKRYEPYVMMVLLDLYCSWRSDPAQYFAFSRDKSRYGKNSRYASIKVGYVGIKELTDKLFAKDYIEYVKGVTYRDPVTHKVYDSYTSKMRAKKKLLKLIVKNKVKLPMISRHPNEAVIKFRTAKDENDLARDIKDFQAPRDVDQSAKVLRTYNALLQKTYIDLDDEMLTDEDIFKMRKGKKPIEYTLDLSKKRVFRVFNNENWKNGGRIYGAWWHGCPKQLRKYILIGGEPVVEFDFSSIHVLLLYAHLGANFLDEGVDAYNEDREFKRDVIKVVMMSAINAKSDKKSDGDTKTIKAACETLVKKFNDKRKEHGFNSHQSLYELLDEIKDRHPRLASFLGSGEGIKLMREDSDIAIEIIKQHNKQNVPVLTIHDSFIVPKTFAPFTIDIMNQAYGKLVSKYLGEDFKSTIETINSLTGEITRDDTSNNMNVNKLIKLAFKPQELTDAHNRLKSRVSSKQIRRQFKWKKNHYQYDKIYRLIWPTVSQTVETGNTDNCSESSNSEVDFVIEV